MQHEDCETCLLSTGCAYGQLSEDVTGSRRLCCPLTAAACQQQCAMSELIPCSINALLETPVSNDAKQHATKLVQHSCGACVPCMVASNTPQLDNLTKIVSPDQCLAGCMRAWQAAWQAERVLARGLWSHQVQICTPAIRPRRCACRYLAGPCLGPGLICRPISQT